MFTNWLADQRALAGLKRDGERAGDRLERTREHLTELQQQVRQLHLACAAMWSLLKQQGLTEEQLLAAMQELDLRDGKLDGTLAPPPVECTACKRKSRASHGTCLYCGAALPDPGAFGTPV